MSSSIEIVQKGFAGGEIGPQLLGRSDVAKYSAGLLLCRNFVVQRHGAVENRAGTIYVGTMKSAANYVRLAKFTYDSFNSYLLEIGAAYTRIWKNGAPLSVAGAINWSALGSAAVGSVVAYSGGLWYSLAEQFAGSLALTVTGTYTAGAAVTLTSSAPLFTQAMVYAGATFTLQAPGSPQITVTLLKYTNTNSVDAVVDGPVPLALQAVATINWKASVPVMAGGTATTITISGGSYGAGAAVTLTASASIFSNEMVPAGVVFTFYTAAGPIPIQVTGYTSGTVAAGVTPVAVPAAIQATATNLWSNLYTQGLNTFSPQGPTFPPGTTTITLSSGSTFAVGQSVTMTASAPVFTAPMAGTQAFTFHSPSGDVYTAAMTGYGSSTSATFTVIRPVPSWLQNTPVTAWSTQLIPPQAGSPYWYQLPSTVFEIPHAIAQSALSSLVFAQNANVLTLAHQSMVPFEIVRLGDLQWVVRPIALGPLIQPPATSSVAIGYGSGSGSTLHTFVYVVTAVNAAGEESAPSVPASGVGNYPSSSLPNIVSWAPVPNAIKYNIYGVTNGVPGLLGSSNQASYNDNNYVANTSGQPPVPLPLFTSQNDYPAVTAFFQQRRYFANTVNKPQTAWASQTDLYNNYNVVTPTAANGAIQFTIAGEIVQPITALVDLGKLVLHTASAEYICSGDFSGAITPTSIGLVRQGTAGSTTLRPVSMSNTDVFVQARGGQVRDLRYDIQSVSYVGKDLTVFSPELFNGRTIMDMTWQQIKNSVIWFVMDNGTLYGLTYIREHEIWAWHRHDTINGLFESAVVIPEGAQDVLYVSVVRVIAGATVRYMEKLAPREFADFVTLSDTCFLDCSLSYDGRSNTAGITTQLTTAGGWTKSDKLTATITGSTPFVAGDVGNTVVLQQYDVSGNLTGTVSILITDYISATQVKGYPDQTVPAWAQLAITRWGKAVHSFAGLAQLEGQTVSALGDGTVVSPLVVTGGTVVTAENFLTMRVGLPIQSQIQTLPLERPQGDSLTNDTLLINEVTAMFFYARGGKYGQDSAHLQPWVQRATEPLSAPTSLYTGPVRLPIQGTWQTTGQVFVQQDDPLPLGISAVTPTGFVGQ